MKPLSRKAFIGSSAVASAAATVRSSSKAATRLTTVRVLVLSGGTAHGAYEGGVLTALWNSRTANQRASKTDKGFIPSPPLAEPFDFVVGTSIGALNGAIFCRQGGPSEIPRLWNTLASRPVLVLRPDYEFALNQRHGVINRGAAVYRLGRDAFASNLQSFCEGEPVRNILREYLLSEDRKSIKPFRIPLIWTATDLTNGCAGYFYRLPTSNPHSPWYTETALERIKQELASQQLASIYADDPVHLVESLRASSAIPAVFEPALISDSANPDFTHVLTDGGVVNNTPFALAMRAAPYLTQQNIRLELYAVVLGNRYEGAPRREVYNLLGTLLNSYNVMTQRLFDDAARRVREAAKATQTAPEVAATKAIQELVSEILGGPQPGPPVPKEIAMYVVQPSTDLLGSAYAFDDQDVLSWNFELGFRDAVNTGFVDFKEPAEFCYLG